ncbi:hypothetical protein ESB00_03750 [Oleiharenicola lentus]|uniref:Histidine kinase domain-containing protein n=1 Tax=Oleiharenicola lentus TaxID=2508720 RepID=A0A4Q1C7W8_9BACT|nr:CHASE4 domain-containing protein [Oleiharenicola lentus]RXK55024.1 hypothetical protein ESB00_03750 [Oleiharenicola lentus]
MTIRSRLVLLLIGLVLIFGFSVAGLRLSHRGETESIQGSMRAERHRLLDRILELTGRSLASFASEYSLWDEMVRYVEKGDPDWAAINIDPSLANFDTQGAWIAGPDSKLLYMVFDPNIGPLPAPPFDQPGFIDVLRREKSLHYFQQTARGLMEVRTGPILPSADIKRMETPRGWFLVARLWNDAQLQRLGEALQGQAVLVAPEERAPTQSDTMLTLERPLAGWDGQVVRKLRIEHDSPALALLSASNREEIVLFLAFGALLILVTVLTLTHQVLRPLQQLTVSLETDSPASILDLQRRTDEFGHLARQAAQSFLHRSALRESEARLRQWMTLHDRLARDMHDGIIQSVYAAGLGVESARNLLKNDRTAADQRLVSSQRMLNDALWQLRTFIQLLEPENTHGQTPAQSLSTLVTNMQALQPVPIIAEIDPAAATRIPPQHELHVLHMAREILSNALRHSGAKQVRIKLTTQADGLVRLEINDNGNGFNPAARSGSGRGLANLTARAKEIDAQLEINSTPGTGTRIALLLKTVTIASSS